MVRCQPRTTGKLNHIPLPGEIRDIIASLVLGSRKIFLPPIGEAKHHPVQIFHWSRGSACTPLRSSIQSHIKMTIEKIFSCFVREALKHLDLEPTLTFTRSKYSAVGLLTVSRQTYEDSYFHYWAKNTFYLPRGPVSHSKLYWRSIRSQHKALVTSIAIQFSIADLTPEVLSHIEQYARKNSDRGRREGIILQEFDSDWEYYVIVALASIWTRKLIWIRRWGSLERLRLEAPGVLPVELKEAKEFEVALRGSGRRIRRYLKPGWQLASHLSNTRVWCFVRQATVQARRRSHAIITTKGWRLFKEEVAQAMKDESRDC